MAHLRRLGILALALVFLTGGAVPLRALADDESADLQIELVGLPLAGGQHDLKVRITNISVWWADETHLRVETIAPTQGNVFETKVENLDPGQSAEFPYTLDADCAGHVVKAEVTRAANWAGNLESNGDNNWVQQDACPSVLPSDPNAYVPQPPIDLTGVVDPNPPIVFIDETQLPGTHTVPLEVGGSFPQYDGRYFFFGCAGGPSSDPGPWGAGWGELEHDGDPCFNEYAQIALWFDDMPVDRVPVKTIDRAVLTYDEGPSQGCQFVDGVDPSCWRSGDGAPEPKPDGCIVVRIPEHHWSDETYEMISYLTNPRPAVIRVAPNAWDVTEPYLWQHFPELATPFEANPGVGYLLAGGLTLDQLEGEDSASCMSIFSNVHLWVTYTVPG